MSVYKKQSYFRLLFLLLLVGLSCSVKKTPDRPAGIAHNVLPSMATWRMDTNTVNLTAKHSPFNVLTSLRSLGRNRNLMDDEVHREMKAIAEYATEKGISIVADLDIRLALPTFEAKYPDELQQLLVLREIDLKGEEPVEVVMNSRDIRDHYQQPYLIRSGAFVKALAYNETADGLIEWSSLNDISGNCTVESATKESVRLFVQNGATNESSKAIVMVAFTYLYADVFAPHLMAFQQEIFEKYADVPLAGAHNDEWGFPATLSEKSLKHEYWYSQHQAKAYADYTNGRDLLADIVLMHKGIKGKEDERLGVINHYGELIWKRTGAVEEWFYGLVKETFGPDGIVAVHPTWFPYPEHREFKKNGLNWWVAKRDWAQTDEVVPFAVRTSLAKKWKSPVWYNMFYRYGKPTGEINTADYEEELWSAALSGGRINNLPSAVEIRGILGSDFVRAETRIRLLNYIQPTPLNCPVAIVFGHAAVTNWASPTFEDTGLHLADSLWRSGVPTDLIPSSEIANGSLQVDSEGYVRYGDQRYTAVILYNPEFERENTVHFFNAADKGKTKLFRIGNWTKDVDGNTFDGNRLLPSTMRGENNVVSLLSEIPGLLEANGIPMQTPATRVIEGFGHSSYGTPTTGFSYLLDGTLIQVAGTKDATGDTLVSTMKVGQYDVTVDAIGVAAVRLDQKGQLAALAAGGLRKVETDKFSLQLDERVDLALWKDGSGSWNGVIQGWDDDIPEDLLAITSNWTRLDLPVPYPRRKQNALRKAVVADVAGKVAGEHGEVTDIDGNTYPTVKIGNQVWMVGNLRTSRYNTGERLAYPGSDKGEWYENRSGAYSWYANDSTKDEALGKLYNWHAVVDNKICPKGWRVPSDADWTTLIDHIDGQSKSKTMGIRAVAGGYRHSYGTYFGSGTNGLWWSSSGTSKRMVWDQENSVFYLTQDRRLPANYGFSVCCVME